MSIFGHQGHSRGASRERYGTGTGRVDPEQHLRKFGTPCAHQAVQPDYFSAAQRKGNIFEFAGTAQVFDAQELGSGLNLHFGK